MMAKHIFNDTSLPALTVRFSMPADVPAVLQFYHANQHHNVDDRGDDVFADRTEKSRTLLVLKPDNTIGMSSMSHPFDQDKKIEIGSTRSRLDGLGLYPFVIASQIIHEFLERAPEECFFACVHKDNLAVTHMLNKKVGWHIVTPTREFADAIGEGDHMDDLTWFRADTDTFAHQARIVAETIQKGYVENKKTGEKLRLDMSHFSLATTFNRHLNELAHGRLGEMMENARPLPVYQARQTFERYLAGATYFPEMSPKP